MPTVEWAKVLGNPPGGHLERYIYIHIVIYIYIYIYIYMAVSINPITRKTHLWDIII